jgi:cell division transport system permease protein
MLTTLSRIIKYGFTNFWRNGWLSVATLSIIVLALVVFESLIMFSALTNSALNSVQEKIDISVYFKSGAPEDDILNAKKSLESLAEVKSVEYISKDKALEIFKEKHADDPAISQSIDELTENPLLASLNIKAHDPKQYAVIAEYLEGSSLRDRFEKITYAQNAIVIDRLSKIIDTAEKGGFLLIAFLAIISVLVTFNTIRLAIYSSRDELGIMRFVGASNSFIRGPYIIEGVIFGILAAVLSTIIIAPALLFISPYIRVFVPEMDLWSYFSSHLILLFFYQIIFGVALGTVSSGIATSKYLKV